MLDANQLDMFLENKEFDKKIYVKFYVNKILKTQNIYDMVEDIFHIENMLSKKDDFIIITKDEPNDTLVQNIKDIWMSDNIYISLLNINWLNSILLKTTLKVPELNVFTVIVKLSDATK